jgi:hypothetical protein
MKINKILLIVSVAVLPFFRAFSQENIENYLPSETTIEKDTVPVYATFKSTRIINAKSNETVHKGELDFIISHRFGDAGGQYGGFETLYGTDNAADIKIAFDYGVTDHLSVGFARAKGATAIRQLLETNIKYKLIEQTERNRRPFGVTLFGNAVVSTMTSNVNWTLPQSDGTAGQALFTNGDVIVDVATKKCLPTESGFVEKELSKTVVSSHLFDPLL